MPNNLEHVNLRSEEVQEILTAVPTWMIRWGNTLVFLLIIGLIGVTWFVKYPDVILAEAVVTTQQPPQKEYANASGKIDTILVKDNQSVKANTPLAIIENTANFKDVFLLKNAIDTLVINDSRFEFPMEKMPFLFLGDIDVDYALFESNYDQYQLNRQLQPFFSQAVANRSSLSELNNRLSDLELQQELNKEELVFKKNEVARSQLLFEQGLIAAQEYENKQLEELQAKKNYKDKSLAISQIKESISNAKLSSINTEISRTKEEQLLLRNVLQSFNRLKKAIADWELKYVVKSSIEGKVSFLDFWIENQTVNSGDLVFTIIPQDNTEYIARLKTPSQNSGKIKEGQSVNIKLANYPDAEFGKLKGRIKDISLTTDEEGFYIVDVVLPSKLITTYQKEIKFKQEMQGTAEIVTEDLRLIERFFYRLKGVFTR